MASQSETPTPWIGVEDLPVHFANAFGVLAAPNAIFMLFGSVVPLGDEPTPYAPIKPIVRLAISPAAMPELIEAMQHALQAHDKEGGSP